MRIKSVRHIRALQSAKRKIECSKLSHYVKELYLYGSVARKQEKWNSDIDLLLVLDPSQKGNYEIRREIVWLKGSITGDEIDAPEIDLKVVFGNEWKNSSQTYYKNIMREGEEIWKKI